MLPFILPVGLYSPLNYLQHLAVMHFILVVVGGGWRKKIGQIAAELFPDKNCFCFCVPFHESLFTFFHTTRENHIIAFPNFLEYLARSVVWVCVSLMLSKDSHEIFYQTILSHCPWALFPSFNSAFHIHLHTWIPT